MDIFAKVNLRLEVGAARPSDGRHELRTIFLPVPQLCDTIVISKGTTGGGITLCQSGRSTGCPQEKNLTWVAVQAFCREFAVGEDWHIELTKRIPVCAGLGGGSADAAATLREMQRLNPGCADEAALKRVALSIGADVPYFLLGGTPALATGVGEILTPIEIPAEYGIIVVYPGCPSPVAWAYQHCSPPPYGDNWPPAAASLESAEALAAQIRNDLAPALERKLPLLTAIRRTMMHAGCLGADVSGSGASLFGICRLTDAPQVRERLKAAFADLAATEVF